MYVSRFSGEIFGLLETYLFSITFPLSVLPSLQKDPRETRRVRVIWHHAKTHAEVLRQAFSSQSELLIDCNGPQQEVSVIYGLLDFTISAR